jgi:hypothetical protein
MKIKCVSNLALILNEYEYQNILPNQFGRFDVSHKHEYPIEIGKEYLVMGIVIFKEYVSYLIDDSFVFTAPCYLFETVDASLNTNWQFRCIKKKEKIYPFIQAIFGYEEFCLDVNSYEDLICNKTDESLVVYFKRKFEFLNNFNE